MKSLRPGYLQGAFGAPWTPYGLAYGTSSYGAQRGAVGEDALDAGKKAVGTSGTVAGLLMAAGGSSSIPVAGWVAAVGLGVAAGTIALVMAVKQRKMERQQIIDQAKALGIPYAEAVPGYLVRVMDMTPDERRAEIASWGEILAGGRGLKSFGRNKEKVKAKLAVAGGVYLVNEGLMGKGPLAQLRQEIALARSDQEVVKDIGWFAPGSTSRNVAIAGSLVAIAFGSYVIYREVVA